jgi:hypothetical protein
LYEKLKTRLYNALYHREKRLEAKYKGDLAKMREDLGFDVQVRVKRRRKSKQQSTATTEEGAPKRAQQDSAITLDNEPQTQTAEDRNASPQINGHAASAGNSSGPVLEPIALVQSQKETQQILNQNLRPEDTDSAHANGSAVSVTSGINVYNSVTGLTNSTENAGNSVIASEVSIFFSTTSTGTNAADPALNIRKNLISCAWT